MPTRMSPSSERLKNYTVLCGAGKSLKGQVERPKAPPPGGKPERRLRWDRSASTAFRRHPPDGYHKAHARRHCIGMTGRLRTLVVVMQPGIGATRYIRVP